MPRRYRASNSEGQLDAPNDRLEPAGRDSINDVTGEKLTSEKSRPGGGRIVYDCTPWSGESRRLFKAMLEGNGFQHVWHGTVVSVREEDEEQVDLLLDSVKATARPALDPGAERLTYEIADWHSALQTEFTDQLTISEVPYEWDIHGNVIVLASDEDLVDEVLEMLPDAIDDEISSDDGVAVHELLDNLFMRSDRLSSRPSDATATVAVEEAAGTLELLSTPFGFEAGEWKKLVESVQALRQALVGNGADEEASDADVAERAAAARDIIRRYI